MRSVPMTSAVSAWPSAMALFATARACRKPAQAARTSIAAARVLPISACTRAAVAGKVWSGVMVPRTIRSRSAAGRPALASARSAARTDMSPVHSPSAAKRRVWMPARLTIQSSDRPTLSETSQFGITRSGR